MRQAPLSRRAFLTFSTITRRKILFLLCGLVAAGVPFSQSYAQTVCTPHLPTKSTVCTTQIDTTKLPNGLNTITVKVTDMSGNVTMKSITIIVQNPVPNPTPAISPSLSRLLK